MNEAAPAEAFARALFRVRLASGERIRRIGVLDAEADTALRAAGCVRHWHIVTPCNPYSRPLSEAENRARLRECAAALDDLRWTHVEACNTAEDGSWPEPGFAIFDAPEDEVCALGRRFEQWAIVGASLNEAPRLIWLSVPGA